MIQSLQSSNSRDKKLLAAEAQQMLSDSKAKIEFLKMRIMKAKQSKEQMTSSNGIVPNNNNNKGTNINLARFFFPIFRNVRDRDDERVFLRIFFFIIFLFLLSYPIYFYLLFIFYFFLITKDNFNFHFVTRRLSIRSVI